MQIKTMTEEQWKPYIRFTDQSSSFTHGWEMGEIYAKLQINKSYEGLLHTVNLEQLELVCKKMGFKLDVETVGEGFEEWRHVKADPLLRLV